MKRFIEKSLGVVLAVLIVGTLAVIATALFGSSVVGLLTLILGFPMAFPMTTCLLVCVFVFVFMIKRK